jgi:hypothetical protein
MRYIYKVQLHLHEVNLNLGGTIAPTRYSTLTLRGTATPPKTATSTGFDYLHLEVQLHLPGTSTRNKYTYEEPYNYVYNYNESYVYNYDEPYVYNYDEPCLYNYDIPVQLHLLGTP